MGADLSFAAKLDFVLKALTLSRGQLASELGVDKSLVSRWGSGAVVPSAHNLGKITRLVARKRPGFTLLDWDRDAAGLAEVFGVATAPPAMEADAFGLLGLPFGTLERAWPETLRRAAAYEGRYLGARPSFMRPGLVVRDTFLLRREAGRLMLRCVGGGYECAGWVAIMQGQLYAVLSDAGDDSLAFMVLHGAHAPRVEALDGLFTSVALDRGRSIAAVPMVLERIGDLRARPEDDDAQLARVKAEPSILPAEALDPGLRAHLFPEVGPAAARADGDLLLRRTAERSRAAGSVGRALAD